MAQGYPPGSYGQQPYGQQPYPQQQQPYPPQYGQAPQYPQAPQYGQPPQYAQQHPQQWAQHPQQQHLQQPPRQALPPHLRPPRPEEASGFRRYPAMLADWLLAIVAGFLAAKAAAGPRLDLGGAYFGALFGVGLGVSFVNQVLLARLTGFSAGKGLMALRVIRAKDGSRPHLWRLTKRWALGFVILAIALITEDYDDEGELVAVRVVRWKHLREYRRAAARLG
ncbi:RDD family protein [Kitasatospora misakiensis]|uniref:RDD family protein n=1 Tax=Kitasatospora misakiensis TaxID=67330 RepID=A0ABW0X4C6_9ACTN